MIHFQLNSRVWSFDMRAGMSQTLIKFCIQLKETIVAQQNQMKKFETLENKYSTVTYIL